MKKIALALVATSTIIGATQANIGTGFYLGAHVGYGATTGKFSIPVAPNAEGTVPGSSDNGSTAANVGIHGGYGWVTGCLYLGGELAYTFENTKVNHNLTITNGGNRSLKRNGYFNIAVRGGYLFTPNTMMYIKLGGNWGKWKTSDTAGGAALAVGDVSSSKNRFSFAPGVGLETAIHRNVYLRGEYVYEFGPSITATNSANAVGAYTSKWSNIRSQSFKLGLSYKF